MCGRTFKGTSKTCSWECARVLISRTKRAAYESNAGEIPDGHKLCTKCGEVKPGHEFSLHARSKDGLQGHCKQCFSDAHKQRGVKERRCAVCGAQFVGRGQTCSQACRNELTSRTKRSKVERGESPIPAGYKLCRRCRTVKPKSEFAASARSRDRLQPHCRLCHGQYDKVDGACEVCGSEFSGSGSTCSKQCAGVLVSRSKLMAFQAARAHIPKGHKQCTRCGEIKRFEEFGKNATSRDGLQYRCTSCLAADTTYRLNCAMRAGMHASLKGTKNCQSWQSLVDYTVAELKAHLEAKFVGSMSWENYGKDGWHIDHIRPIASFSFEFADDAEFRQCWALENLQPLWAFDNISKGARWDPDD